MAVCSRNLREVWKARIRRPHRNVALKLLKTQFKERSDRDAGTVAAGNTVMRAK
jgi:hypothetical protein